MGTVLGEQSSVSVTFTSLSGGQVFETKNDRRLDWIMKAVFNVLGSLVFLFNLQQRTAIGRSLSLAKQSGR